jgi:extradiol dioxygenase
MSQGAPERITGLGYLGIHCPHADQWNEYGPEVLGLQLASPGPDGAVRLRADDRAFRIAIHPADVGGFAYAGWEVAHAEAFHASLERMEKAGAQLHQATEDELSARQVRKMAWFLDGEGFRHELFYGQISTAHSFRPGRPHHGFVTGEAGLGHLAVAVRDFVGARRFYLDVMGFSVSDEMDAHFPILFFHTNSRHHSVAAVEVPESGLFHLMLQTRELDDVGLALDRCEALGYPIRRTLGRHPNDHTVSCYLGTPSGFDIELGWGPIEVVPGDHVTTVMEVASMWGHKQLTPSTCLPPVAYPR